MSDKLQQQLAAVTAENERLRDALKAHTGCDSCNGEKQITIECEACLCGDSIYRCTCKDEKPFECPQCDGNGFDCLPEYLDLVQPLHEAALADPPAGANDAEPDPAVIDYFSSWTPEMIQRFNDLTPEEIRALRQQPAGRTDAERHKVDILRHGMSAEAISDLRNIQADIDRDAKGGNS